MDSIQELIDRNKHAMPMAVAKDLLELCAARERFTHLYQIKYARIQAYPHYHRDDDDDVEVGVETHVEYAEKICEVGANSFIPFVQGKASLPENWIGRIADGPFVVKFGDVKILVIAIEKYSRGKQARR